MVDSAFAALAALAVLQVKHLLCDFFLQTSQQIESKGRYGHPGGLVHAGLHVVATLPVFAIYPVRMAVAIAILLAEFLIHYHVDWLKAVVTSRRGWTVSQKQYWWAYGVDQFAHQLTYIGMVLALVLASS